MDHRRTTPAAAVGSLRSAQPDLKGAGSARAPSADRIDEHRQTDPRSYRSEKQSKHERCGSKETRHRGGYDGGRRGRTTPNNDRLRRHFARRVRAHVSNPLFTRTGRTNKDGRSPALVPAYMSSMRRNMAKRPFRTRGEGSALGCDGGAGRRRACGSNRSRKRADLRPGMHQLFEAARASLSSLMRLARLATSCSRSR